MNIGKEIAVKKILQAKLYSLVRCIAKMLTKPERKFVKNMIYGIIRSKTCIIRQIVISNDEKASVKKVSEKYRNHLSKPHLHTKISHAILMKSARKINRDTIIAVDDSDIMKPEAEKMEGLKIVRDGSNVYKHTLGYKLMNIAAVNSKGANEIEIVPVMSELFSDEIEIDTAKNVLFDQINDIQIASENKGIFTFDRGYDDKKLFDNLLSNDADFIVRSKTNRKLYLDGNEMKFIEVAKCAKLDMTFRTSSKNEIRAGAIRVEIKVNPHKLKIPQTVSLWLIVCRYVNKPKNLKDDFVEEGGFFYLYANIRHLNDNKKALVEKCISGYKLRWKIEEFHRHVKQDFGWEKMQLMTYVRLKNLNAILLAALSLIYSMYDIKLMLYRIFPNKMMDRERDKDRIIFIYYRITAIANYLFSFWKLRERKKYKGQYAEQMQLKLKF